MTVCVPNFFIYTFKEPLRRIKTGKDIPDIRNQKMKVPKQGKEREIQKVLTRKYDCKLPMMKDANLCMSMEQKCL
jgi:hypothetical protein